MKFDNLCVLDEQNQDFFFNVYNDIDNSVIV